MKNAESSINIYKGYEIMKKNFMEVWDKTEIKVRNGDLSLDEQLEIKIEGMGLIKVSSEYWKEIIGLERDAALGNLEAPYRIGDVKRKLGIEGGVFKKSNDIMKKEE